MPAEITVLVSLGRHLTSGRLRPAAAESRAIALAVRAMTAPVRLLHAGPADRAEPVVRDYAGMGATEAAILDLPDGSDPIPALLSALRARPPGIVLCGVAAEAGEGSGMAPYLMAQGLGRPIVTAVVALEAPSGEKAVVHQALPGGRRRRLLVEGPFVATIGTTGPPPRLSAFGPARRATIARLPAEGAPDPIAALPSRPAGPAGPQARALAPAGRTDAASRLDAILNRGRGLSGQDRIVLAEASPEEAARAILAYLRREGLVAGGFPSPQDPPHRTDAMKFLDAEAVHRLLDYHGLVEALREAHRGVPPATHAAVMDEPGLGENKFVSLVAWVPRGVIAVKLVGVFPANLALEPPQPSVQGLVAVFDAATGAPLLAADGAAMTFRKTAADSALGASYLARDDAQVLLVVGAGGLAPHVAMAHASVRPSIRRVLIWNRTPARAQALAESLRIAGAEVEAVRDLDEAVSQADVISCVTLSTEPLVKGALLKAGAHVDLIGAYLPTMREADDETIRRARVFVDTRVGMEGAGDLAQPAARGLFRWDAVEADLYQLCGEARAGRRSRDEITVFKNVGGGHLDLFTARRLSERLSAA